jgi:hypothetical protein
LRNGCYHEFVTLILDRSDALTVLLS